MPTISRRDVILSAPVAAAAFGLDRSLAIAAPPRSQKTPAPAKGFFRYKVGDAKCTAVYDGIWEKPHDPAYFSNATVAETKRALARAGLTTAFVTIPISVFVIELNGKLVLCDAGGGNQVQAFNPAAVFVSGKMMTNMRAAGAAHPGRHSQLEERAAGRGRRRGGSRHPFRQRTRSHAGPYCLPHQLGQSTVDDFQ